MLNSLTNNANSITDQQNRDQPLKIIEIADEEKDGKTVHKLTLNEYNLKKIMLHPDVANNAVMIVAIAGALRKGKSFLLDFFIKYLEAQVNIPYAARIAFNCFMSSFCTN